MTAPVPRHPTGRRIAWFADPTGGPVGGAVGVGLAVVLAAAAVLAPTAVGPALVLVAVAVAVTALAVADPAVALVLLVVASFVRPAVHSMGMPVPVPLLLTTTALCGLVLAVARGRLAAPRLGAAEIAMLSYLAWNVVSWAAPHDLSPYGPNSVALFVVSGVAFPFGLYVIGRAAGGSDRLVRILLWTVLALTAYSALLGVAQIHGPRWLVWPGYVAESPTWPGRAVGIVDQPVTNGVLLVVGVTVCLYLARTAGTRRLRGLALTVAAVATYTVYLTHTRAVWLAALAVVVLAVGVRETRRAALAVLAAGAVVAAVNWATLTSADRAAGGVGSTSEVDDRLNMIATAWWAIGEHPWVGWGVARFQHLNIYYHQQWSPSIDWRRGHGIASHENELGIAAELGIIGLALWLAVLVVLARRLFLVVQRGGPGPVRDLGLLGAAALVTLVVVGTTADLRLLDFAEGLVLLLVGVAVGRAAAPGATRECGVTSAERPRCHIAGTGTPVGAR